MVGEILLDELLSELNTGGIFFSGIMPMDNQSGSLSLFGCDQSAALCKEKWSGFVFGSKI